VYEMR